MGDKYEDLINIQYIGDGVYAGFDGYQIQIWTSDGYNLSPRIAIEDNTLLSLIAYAKQYWKVE